MESEAEPAPRVHAVDRTPDEAAEDTGSPDQAAPVVKAGADAAVGTAGRVTTPMGQQPGWNQSQSQLTSGQMQGQPPVPHGFQPVMPGAMIGMMTPDGFIPGGASLLSL